MRRVAVLGALVGVAASLVLAQSASAAPSDSVERALLTSVEVKHASGSTDPLTDFDTWCATRKGSAVITCAREWPGDIESAITPTHVRIARYPTSTAAAEAFRSTVRDLLDDKDAYAIGKTVVTSTRSTLLFVDGSPMTGPPVFYLGFGLRQVGSLLITVESRTDGPVSSASATTCTWRMLAAQVAKASRLLR